MVFVSALHSSPILSVFRSAQRFFRCYLLIFGNSDFHIFNKINPLIKTGSKLPVFSANTAGTDPLLSGFIRVHPCPLITHHLVSQGVEPRQLLDTTVPKGVVCPRGTGRKRRDKPA